MDIHDDLEIYLQQIENVLDSNIGEVLGASDMSIDLESLIFEFDVDTVALKSKIAEVIYTYCTYSRKFKTNIDVKFAKGTVRDICLIDIIVDDVKRIGVLVK
jgi:hypothetical protein